MSAELIHNLPEREYHADIATLSASGAKVLLGKRPPSQDSDALSFGSLVHVVLLEPDRLHTYPDEMGFVLLDVKKIGLKKDGKPADSPTSTAAWKEAVAGVEKAGKKVMDPDVWRARVAKAEEMAEAVLSHPEAGRLFARATAHEVSAYADHPSGARVRARFDLVGPGYIADVKTTFDGNPEDFGRTMLKYLYHVSAANYIDIARANGLDADRFDLICVEKEKTPGGEYRVSVLEIHPDAIDRGRELMALACDRWLQLGKRIDLPSYGPGRHVIDLPPWGYEYDEFDDIKIGGVA